MRILCLTKFPPTQGGEASKSYWIARGLAQRGHEIHIVTNSNETDKAFLVNDASDPARHLPPNAFVHFIDSDVDFHIPFHRAFVERLATKALDIVERYDVEVVEAAHLTPFGVAALIVKACTGLPLVLRHGGSDVGVFWQSSAFRTLLTRVIQAADRVIINSELAPAFAEVGVSGERLGSFRYFIDQREFRPDGPQASHVPTDRPVLLFSGKITPGKRLIPLMEALREIDLPFTLLILPVAFKVEMVRELAGHYGLADKTLVLPPRPCWEMPSMLRSVAAVFCLETNFTTSNHWPLFPREVMSSGTCLVLSREQYERGAVGNGQDGSHVVVVDPDDHADLVPTLRRLLADVEFRSRVARNGLELARPREDYDVMLDDLERVYNGALEHAYAVG